MSGGSRNYRRSSVRVRRNENSDTESEADELEFRMDISEEPDASHESSDDEESEAVDGNQYFFQDALARVTFTYEGDQYLEEVVIQRSKRTGQGVHIILGRHLASLDESMEIQVVQFGEVIDDEEGEEMLQEEFADESADDTESEGEMEDED